MIGKRLLFLIYLISISWNVLAIKHNISPETEITIITHFKPIDSCSNFVFPIICFEQHNYIKAVFTYYQTPYSADITMISHGKCDNHTLQYPIISSSDSVVFTIKRVGKNCIKVSANEQIATFSSSLFEDITSFDIILPKNNHFIGSSSISFESTSENKAGLSSITIIIGLFVLYAIFLSFYYYRKAKKGGQGNILDSLNKRTDGKKTMSMIPRSTIKLFGNILITNKNSEDITKSFSPLLLQILILLIVNNHKGGISSAEFTSLLWNDKQSNSARNNRSVNLTKLKRLLDTIGDYSISKNGDYWLFKADTINIDYYDYIDIINSGVYSGDNANAISLLLNNHPFLPHLDYLWSKDVKDEFQNNTVSFLEHFLLSFQTKDNPELVIMVCNTIFSLDTLNEIALTYICRAYKENGNYPIARQLFSNFAKEYSSLYREEYHKQLSEILMD